MSNLKPDDYIEHARIFLEEKWINDAKEMRDLFDHLEDKGIIENYWIMRQIYKIKLIYEYMNIYNSF